MFAYQINPLTEVRTSYNEATMWDQFLEDIDSAKFHIIIHVPFIALSRMQTFWWRFERLRKRGVVICVFLREPEFWEGRESLIDQGFEALIAKLREIGVHVTSKRLIHEKLAIIDGRILWDGSLNFLSHRNTKERANRFASREIVREAMSLHDMNNCDQCESNKNTTLSGGTVGALLGGLSVHRKLAGVSQGAFAKSRQTSQSWVSRVESGKHESVTVGTLCEYALALGVRPVLVPDDLVPAVSQMLEDYIQSMSVDSQPSGKSAKTCAKSRKLVGLDRTNMTFEPR